MYKPNLEDILNEVSHEYAHKFLEVLACSDNFVPLSPPPRRLQDDSSVPTLDELGISELATEGDAAATFQPEVEM